MELNGLNIHVIRVGAIQTNCYVVHKKDSQHCILVDPGEDANRITDYLKEKRLVLDAILLTHGHFDHIMAVPEIIHNSRIQVIALEEEKELLEDPKLNCTIMGAGVAVSVTPTKVVRDGDILNIAGMDITVLHTPGHTSGSCCYYIKENKLMFVGDTVFYESVGRTDLPTGSEGAILRSIENKLMPIVEEVKLLPGHGEFTSLSHEKRYNPYFEVV